MLLCVRGLNDEDRHIPSKLRINVEDPEDINREQNLERFSIIDITFNTSSLDFKVHKYAN